jgi:hypothetical protein
VGQFSDHLHALPPAGGSEEPSLGTIKRAIHELSCATTGPARRDSGAMLREANDLLRRLARRNGIDPDGAVQRSLEGVKALRERMLLASITNPDQPSD